MKRVKYTGTEPMSMTYYEMSWQPDEIKPVDDDVYKALRHRADFEDVKDEDEPKRGKAKDEDEPKSPAKAKDSQSVSGGAPAEKE